MNDYRNDIERYKKGELTPEEMHSLEKKALSDPFLADALDGLERISSEAFSDDLTEIRRAATLQKSTKPIFTPLRIAAGIIFLVSISVIVFLNLKNPEIELAQHSEVSESPLIEEQKEMVIEESKDEDANIGNPVTSTIENKTTEKQKITNQVTVEKNGVTEIAAAPTKVETEEQNALSIVTEDEIANVKEISPPIQAEGKKIESVTANETQGAPSLKSAARSKSTSANLSSIRGKVVSKEDNTPLPGVNVILKGTNTGTVTDVNGNYEIDLVTTNAILVFSFIGLQNLEASPTSNEHNVQMNLDLTQLSEVVVVGYRVEAQATFEMAEPIGGRKAFKKYLEENLVYPTTAIESKTEGKVTIEFIVKTNGELVDFVVVRGIGNGCDNELIRLIKEGPSWSSSKRNNALIDEKIRVRFNFKLPN